MLRSFPHYAPNEMLYAYFTSTQADEKRMQAVRQFLQEAKAEGTWDAHMRPLRNIMSRVRQKLQAGMHLTILTIFETGAILSPTQSGVSHDQTDEQQKYPMPQTAFSAVSKIRQLHNFFHSLKIRLKRT